jgi:hypothetical protein
MSLYHTYRLLYFSVADPDPNPDPANPHVFGLPGSGSISQRYGSGSRSFYHEAKIVRKTLISTVSTQKCHGSATLLYLNLKHGFPSFINI